jgi:hypothetical protein
MGPVPAVSQPVKKKKSIAKRSPTRPRHGLLFLSPTSFLPLRDCSHRRREEATAPSSPPRWYVRLPSPPPPPDHPFSRGAPIRSDPIPRLPSLPVFPPCINRGIGGIGRKLRNPPRLFAGLAWIRTRPESLSILSTTVSFDSLESRLAGVVLVLAVSVALLVTVLCRQ